MAIYIEKADSHSSKDFLKSCIKVEQQCSDFFFRRLGVRQGENLSPLLFAIYLNDLNTYIADKSVGLATIGDEVKKKLGWEKEDEDVMFKMFVLLYADDTAICAESIQELQTVLNTLSDYCEKWSLQINTSKTKVVVFSRGKIRNIPNFQYRGML